MNRSTYEGDGSPGCGVIVGLSSRSRPWVLRRMGRAGLLGEMQVSDCRFVWHGLRCLELVFCGEPLGPELFRRLRRAGDLLVEVSGADGVVVSYRSLALYWDQIPDGGVEDQLRDVELAGGDDPRGAVGRHQFGVRYDGEDLTRVAERSGLSQDEVVSIHSGAVYTVAAVGFLPHFGYLWGLDSRLATARLAVPRARVPVGAVGIGGGQTGVYPLSLIHI